MSAWMLYVILSPSFVMFPPARQIKSEDSARQQEVQTLRQDT